MRVAPPSPLMFATVEREMRSINLANIELNARAAAKQCLDAGEPEFADKWRCLADIAHERRFMC